MKTKAGIASQMLLDRYAPPCVLVTVEGTVQEAFGSVADLLGFTASEAVQADLKELLPASLVETVMALVGRASTRQQPAVEIAANQYANLAGTVAQTLRITAERATSVDLERSGNTDDLLVLVTFESAAEALPRKRERQQEAIMELGRAALQATPLDSLFDQAVRTLAARLNVGMAKLMQLTSNGEELLVRAGIGWHQGIVGTARVHTGRDSQAGFTLEQSETVVVRDFAQENRFTRPRLLAEHDVVCGASVIIGPTEAPWGVLGAHDKEVGICAFDDDDVNFMQAMANTLWLAISQRKAADTAEAERRELRQFIDAMPFQLSVVSPDERYLIVNDAYKIWDKDLSDVEGAQVNEVLSPETYRHAEPYIKAALRGEAQRYELRTDYPDGSDRINLVTYQPRLGRNGNYDGFYAAALDITPLKRAEREVAERRAQYEVVGESIPYGLWTCNPAGELTYISQSFLDMAGMSIEEALQFGWAGKLVPGTAEETIALWKQNVAEGGDWEHEHQFLSKDGTIVTILSIGRPIRDERGVILSWSGLNLDITERKRQEQRTKVISDELDHRVKNILSLVTSIAGLSGRNARSVPEFRENFEARIQALARAHQTLADGNWDGMSMRRLVENELGPYAQLPCSRITIEGPAVELSARSAQPVSLVVHELATNAVKHGALSIPDGTISITWGFEGADGSLALKWVEDGLSGLEAPAQRGFGSTVITRAVEGQCDASVDLDFAPTGLHYRLSLPAKTLRMQDTRNLVTSEC